MAPRYCNGDSYVKKNNDKTVTYPFGVCLKSGGFYACFGTEADRLSVTLIRVVHLRNRSKKKRFCICAECLTARTTFLLTIQCSDVFKSSLVGGEHTRLVRNTDRLSSARQQLYSRLSLEISTGRQERMTRAPPNIEYLRSSTPNASSGPSNSSMAFRIWSTTCIVGVPGVPTQRSWHAEIWGAHLNKVTTDT